MLFFYFYFLFLRMYFECLSLDEVMYFKKFEIKLTHTDI